MFQKLSVNGFKWIKKLSKFNEYFIKNYNENNHKRYIFEVHVEYPKKVFNLHNDLLFLAERKKLKNVISLFVTYIIKKTMLSTYEL